LGAKRPGQCSEGEWPDQQVDKAATTILARWQPALAKFKALRAKYLIYE